MRRDHSTDRERSSRYHGRPALQRAARYTFTVSVMTLSMLADCFGVIKRLNVLEAASDQAENYAGG